MKENVIEINKLVKEYKMFSGKKDRLLETILPKYEKHTTFKALNDISFNVEKGEILGILGKNGAGKSTLLKIVTGVVTQTSGKVKVKGKISSLLELGAAFNGELTGMQNIYQHGQVMGLTNEQIKEKEKEIIEFADIGEHLYQPVKTYSSGMFARLAFACAINVDPEILIVDEVLSVGDIAFQLKCFKKFEQFKEEGRTILFVTHNINDVIRNCTRAIIIDGGKKIYDGEVKGGVEKYKKIMVKLDNNIEEPDIIEEISKNTEEKILNKVNDTKNKEEWKKNYTVNPNIIEYGNGQAELIDFGIFDTEGNIIPASIENDKEVILKSKVEFKETVKDPIFTMTVKDFRGLDMMGTNTIQEKILTGEFNKGDVVVAEFRQKIKLAPNKYTLSFSCTHFNANGELEVLSRKYDALLIEITSNKDCVGLYRLDSNITVTKI